MAITMKRECSTNCLIAASWYSCDTSYRIITCATHRITKIRNRVGFRSLELTLDISGGACSSSADLINRGNCAKFEICTVAHITFCTCLQAVVH